MEQNFIIKGDIAYNDSQTSIITLENGYLICEKGICKGAFHTLPDEYKNYKLYDYSGKLIIPGMTDLHVHAPQYTFRGVGMDLELLEWLNKYTFPEEAHYCDIDYARKAYSYFTYDLKRGFSTRAVIFATLHTDSTIELMEQLDKTGIVSFVGKVNMDRNSVPDLLEASADDSYNETLKWLDKIDGRFKNTYPIITPRFIPSCSDELMKKLGALTHSGKLRLQSHLSENMDEIAWVADLVKESSSYANAYEIFNAMGTPDVPAIMAHCVYSNDEEIDILKKYGCYVAHCPSSNMNLSSGIAPVRKFLNSGLNIGLGTDVAGGSSLNMLQEILLSIQASKMYYRLIDNSMPALSFEEAFYLATMGGGSYFGKVGSFKPDFELDALILDDSSMYSIRDFSIRERIERACYNDADVKIISKYVKGENIFSRDK